MDYQSTVVSPTGVTKIGKTVSAELPQVKDQSFNMRDRLNDMLATEKYNLVNYQIAINELINPQLRQVVDKNCTRLQGLHDQFFAELFNLGEYQADIALYPEIADAIQVFTNYKAQLPYQ
ncbi:MAG: spore coat protein [Syntrophomonadaceae bacterium]|jgi:hypothetical protein|nr:spore coat protein [Syntrophomonadaceae bacterium]